MNKNTKNASDKRDLEDLILKLSEAAIPKVIKIDAIQFIRYIENQIQLGLDVTYLIQTLKFYIPCHN